MRGPIGKVPGAALGSAFFLFFTATPRHSTTYSDSQIDHRQIDQSWLFLVELTFAAGLMGYLEACTLECPFHIVWRFACLDPTDVDCLCRHHNLLHVCLLQFLIPKPWRKSSKIQYFLRAVYLRYFLNCSPLKSLVMSSAGRFASYGILTRSNRLKVTTKVSPFRVVPSRWSLEKTCSPL